MGDDLADVINDLLGPEPAVAEPTSLRGVLGDRLREVLQRGLCILPEASLGQLLQQPKLLLDLQEAIFCEGGSYWDTVAGAALRANNVQPPSLGQLTALIGSLERTKAERATHDGRQGKGTARQESSNPKTSSAPRRGPRLRSVALFLAGVAGTLLVVLAIRWGGGIGQDSVTSVIVRNPEQAAVASAKVDPHPDQGLPPDEARLILLTWRRPLPDDESSRPLPPDEDLSRPHDEAVTAFLPQDEWPDSDR